LYYNNNNNNNYYYFIIVVVGLWEEVKDVVGELVGEMNRAS